MPRIIVNEDVCKGCGMCVYACPKKSSPLQKTKSTRRATIPRA